MGLIKNYESFCVKKKVTLNLYQYQLHDGDSSLSSEPSKLRSLTVAPDILRRLFPARTRRIVRILPLTRLEMNLFRFCSGLKVLGYFMILLVVAVVGVSYYAVVVSTWWPILIRGDHGALSALAALIIFVFHFLLIMLLWSYFTTVFTDPGSVPEHFRREMGGGDSLEAGTSTDQGAFGSLGYCTKCRNVKPPRCHHCSVCQRCVLKMDHHCVWIVNCVGARNYKFFLLFLFYTFLETMLDVIVLLPSFIEFFSQAIKHSSSPGKLASLVLAFDSIPLMQFLTLRSFSAFFVS
ncbi:Palmitoyltransferase DHHC domain [Arabidopsis suecica]|nr:Palmitoyltransferase DHHC domain [Arabidopsis suecica]